MKEWGREKPWEGEVEQGNEMKEELG